MLEIIIYTGLFLSFLFLPSFMNTLKDPLSEINGKEDKSKNEQDDMRIGGDICLIGNGKDYKGKVSQTKSGLTCQKWNINSPHSSNYVDLGDHNYCRNPDDASGVWCYTASVSKRWELCNVPACVHCDGNSRYLRFCGECGNHPSHCGGQKADCRLKDDFCVNIRDTSNKQGDMPDEPEISSNKLKDTPYKQGYMLDKPKNSPSKYGGTPDKEVGMLDETGVYLSEKTRSTSTSHKSRGVPYIINIYDKKLSTTADETLAIQHKSRSRQDISGDTIDRHGKELNKPGAITTIPVDIQGELSIISNITGDIPAELKNEKEQFFNIFIDLQDGAPIQHKNTGIKYESDDGLDQHRGTKNYPDYLPIKHDEYEDELRLDPHRGSLYYTQNYPDYIPDKPAYNRDDTQNYPDYITNKHDESNDGLRLDQHRGKQYYTQNFPDYAPDKLAFNRDETGHTPNQHKSTIYYTQNAPDYPKDNLKNKSNKHKDTPHKSNDKPDKDVSKSNKGQDFGNKSNKNGDKLGSVSCGDHTADVCSNCGKSAGLCNGDCAWELNKCMRKTGEGVVCGGHTARKCSKCGDNAALCNGDCKWKANKCQKKD